MELFWNLCVLLTESMWADLCMSVCLRWGLGLDSTSGYTLRTAIEPTGSYESPNPFVADTNITSWTTW